MTSSVGATEAAAILGVTKPTLYAYVSRGLLSRRTAVDGRTSLYSREEVETMASRSRRRTPVERPSIDVQVASSITELHDDHVNYRDHDVRVLVESCSFEQVAELLFTGEMTKAPVRWTVDHDFVARCQAVVDSSGVSDPTVTLMLAASVLADEEPMSAADTARRLLSAAPTLLGGPSRGAIASRLARAWTRRSHEAVVNAISTALILLADHELATSTLAVRLAASVRSDPASAIACGLATVRGRLHGAAGWDAAVLFRNALVSGPVAAVQQALELGRLPGFGHSVYRRGDPRFEPLLDRVKAIPAREKIAVVEAVIAEAGRAIGHLPNVDLALGALAFVSDLPRRAPVFALARIAGWAAHYAEEIEERPVRYRGMTRRR